MAQTAEGALKIAAAKAGMSIDDYQAKLDEGSKWCTGCKDWHERQAFGKDKSRSDGLAATCLSRRKMIHEATYVPKAEPISTKGRIYSPPRDGDKVQARRRINHMVDAGAIADPNTLPCVDCGHVYEQGKGPRHEYDHYLGYAAGNHERVEAVCAPCHHKRERKAND